MAFPDWFTFPTMVLLLEQEGLVTRTFRRLDPDRQQGVLQAILDEAGEKGPAAINIKEVAQRAGVSVGSLYQYFGSRQRLVDFAVALCARYLTASFEEARSLLIAMPLREALSAYLTYGIEWSRTQLGFIQFFGRAAYQGDAALAESVVRPVATAMRQIVHAMLAAAADRGEIRRDVDIEAIARVINALTISVGDSQLFPFLNNYLQVSDETMPFGRVLESLLGLIENGIAPIQREAR